MKIELEQQSGGFFIRIGDKFSDGLARDEALGVVAAALFGNGPLPYMKSYAEHAAWAQYYLGWSRGQFPALPATVEAMPQSDFVIFRRELIADGRFLNQGVEQ